MEKLTLHIMAGPRKTAYALSDTTLPGSRPVSIGPDELVEYLQVKAEYERWQARLARIKRYGW